VKERSSLATPSAGLRIALTKYRSYAPIRQAELAAAKQTQMTPTGKMTFTVLGAVAEPERSLIVARAGKARLKNPSAGPAVSGSFYAS